MKQVGQSIPPKKILKDLLDTKQVSMLGGQFAASIRLNRFEEDDHDKEKPAYTYNQHRLFLKKNGVSYFEKYQPPKKEADIGAPAQDKNLEEDEKEGASKNKEKDFESLTAAVTGNMNRNLSLPQLGEKRRGKKNPTSQKQEQDAMIFNEVFIQPRAVKLT